MKKKIEKKKKVTKKVFNLSLTPMNAFLIPLNFRVVVEEEKVKKGKK